MSFLERRLRKRLQGHLHTIYNVRVSPNNVYLASCGQDMLIRLWRVRDGSPLGTLRGHEDTINTVAFSQDS